MFLVAVWLWNEEAIKVVHKELPGSIQRSWALLLKLTTEAALKLDQQIGQPC